MVAETKINLDNVAQYIEDVHTLQQNARINALTYFQQIQTNNNSLLQNQLKLMTKILPKKDPYLMRVNNCIQHTASLANRLGSELQIARIQIPSLSPNQTMIHGRITDQNLQGAKDLVVSLVDNNGKSLGFAGQTDPSGYYSMTMDNAAIEKISKERGGVYLNVHTQDNVLVHDSSTPLKIQTGINAYHVTIGDTKKSSSVS